MRSIFLSLVQLGGMQFTLAITALVRNKVLALRLGADGFGEFNQLAITAGFATAIAGLGMFLSLNRNVAATQDHSERQRMLAQANSVNIALSSFLIIAAYLLLLFRPTALGVIGLEPTGTIQIAALIIILYVPLEVAVQQRIAFLTAILDIQGLVRGRALAVLVATVLAVPIIWFGGIIGAAIQLLLLGLLLILLLDRRCRVVGFAPWAFTWNTHTFRHLAAIGSASLIAGFAQSLGDIVTRTLLIGQRGPEEVGLYQAAVSIGYQVKAVVLGGAGSYMTAKVSQTPTTDHVNKTSNDLLQVVAPLAAILFSGLSLFALPAIAVLYSPEFFSAVWILPYLIIAEYVNVMVWVTAAPILAFNHVRWWLGLGLTEVALRTGLGILLLQSLGGVGVALGYLIATVIHLVTTSSYVILRFGVGIAATPVRTFVFGLILLIGVSVAGATESIDLRRYALGAIAIAAYGAIAVHWSVGWTTVTQSLREWLGRRN